MEFEWTCSPYSGDSDPGIPWSPCFSIDDTENFVPIESPVSSSFYSSPISSSSSPASSSSSMSSPPSSSFSPSPDAPRPHGKVRRPSRCPTKRLQQRQAANFRERKRMKTINDAFDGLASRIPELQMEKKMSKVDTLRLAIRYIHYLTELVGQCGDAKPNNGQSATKEENDKIIIRCHNRDMIQSDIDEHGQPLYGHSLSWRNEKQTQIGPNGRLTAKVWVPEDPRTFDTGLEEFPDSL